MGSEWELNGGPVAEPSVGPGPPGPGHAGERNTVQTAVQQPGTLSPVFTALLRKLIIIVIIIYCFVGPSTRLSHNVTNVDIFNQPINLLLIKQIQRHLQSKGEPTDQ